MAATRERIQLTGEPIEVELNSSVGKPIVKDGKTDYIRICDDDQRIMFCPPQLEMAITESGAEAGDVIQIKKVGTGKQARWDVAIVSEPAQPPASRQAQQTAARPAAAPASQPHTAAPQQAAAPVPARQINSESVEMAEAFFAAIEAHKAAEEYAATAGLQLRFCSPDAIRATATTIYIGRQKR